MKYFYINNSLCSDCSACLELCPTTAVYIEDGRKYIDHSKCTSCGTCLRACDSDAVEVEDIERIIKKMERADVYLTNIRRLEKELTSTKERLDAAEDSMDAIIRSLPVAAVITAGNGRIVTANRLFAELTGMEPILMEQMPENLSGEDLRTILGLSGRSTAAVFSESTGQSLVADIRGTAVAVSFHEMAAGMIFCTVSRLDDPHISSAMILQLLRRAVDRKMETVRKIGALLGDEASAEITDLNTAIDILESSSADVSEGDNITFNNE